MSEEYSIINVVKAVQEFSNGKSKEFYQVTAALKNETIPKDLLSDYLSSLIQSIPYLYKDHETLIGVAMSIKWTDFESPVPEKYLNFISELVSAKSYYVNVCMRQLIKKFVAVEDEENLQASRYEPVHQAISMIRKLAPISEKHIVQHIKKMFPYIGKSTFILQTYIINILKISSSSTLSTRYNILALIIDKLLSIDVRISKQDLEKIAAAHDEELQFQGDDMTSALCESGVKLDTLLVIMFTYTHSLCHVNNLLVFEEADSLFHDLLNIFSEVILKTQQSSHVQFVVFYVASFHKKFSVQFLARCWDILQNPNIAQVIRQASSAYLASFLARAKYVDKALIKDQLKQLSEWLHRYLDNQDIGSCYADFHKHSAFYSICQTLFYVFIYHHKHFLETIKRKEFIKSLNFMRIVTSKLNPLKFCLNSVVNLFARITRMHEVVFCYSVIERNNRYAINELSFERNKTGNISQDLEMFFPFDPFVLPKSSGFITPIFLEWNGDDLDDDIENSHNELDDVEYLTDGCIDENIVSTSFDMMCISPGFHLSQQKSS